MRSVVLVSGDFVTTGGMDRANYALASYLARKRRSVILVAHRAAPELLATSMVHMHRVPKLLGSYFLSGPLLDQVGRFWARRLATKECHVIVNGGNCALGDVNWVHYVHAAAPLEADSLRHRLKHRLFLRSESRALRHARLIIANSARTRSDLLAHYDLEPARVHVVYYGTDPEQFRPAAAAERTTIRLRMGWAPDRPLVAFVGALGDHRKGFDTLFASWQFLCQDPAWNCDLLVIGTGRALPAWKARAARAGLAERIRFLGFRQDVPDLLRACDALVSPTRYEAYGLNVQEALCCGLPAFVSRSAGVAERYPSALHDLLLPDADDACDLSRRLQIWQANPDRYRSALQGISDALRAYTWDDMAEAIRARIDDAA